MFGSCLQSATVGSGHSGELAQLHMSLWGCAYIYTHLAHVSSC